MNFNLLNNLVGLCSRKGLTDAVLCPGSRSAPITLAFLRNKSFTCRTFSDERSAAFIALGIAQQKRAPVALVCTSGSAAYNFAPAISEAFFQHVPLLVLTADRPAAWIDQWDGQTIRQTNLYNNHVKKYYELPVDDPHPDAEWHAERIMNEAINLSQSGVPGPVHINIPFREPLYPSGVTPIAESTAKKIDLVKTTAMLSDGQLKSLAGELNAFRKILIVSGQNDYNDNLGKSLEDFHEKHSWPVVGDILSNLHGLPFFCRYTDTYLGQVPQAVKESLRPDLIITFGKSLVAKNLKLFLRTLQPKAHWHVQPAGESADTFKSLTKIIAVEPEVFFRQFISYPTGGQNQAKDFEQKWLNQEDAVQQTIGDFFRTIGKGEFNLVHDIIHALPMFCNLHLANSMSVRYANHIGLTSAQGKVRVFSNRGTSGIDGCTSTSLGHALASESPNILITGDQAFFYDRNAFWHNYKVPNLHIVVLNNHGGLIFNLIDGPSGQPEAEEYFITRQTLDARSLAAEFGLVYQHMPEATLNKFFTSTGNIQILEIESSQSESKIQFEAFKNLIRKNYGT